jgi:hypothetical protein
MLWNNSFQKYFCSTIFNSARSKRAREQASRKRREQYGELSRERILLFNVKQFAVRRVNVIVAHAPTDVPRLLRFDETKEFSGAKDLCERQNVQRWIMVLFGVTYG